MSTFAVTVERLTILPHPNAERLELAQVGLYHAVVAKGQYKTGDLALYIPEQAILPDDLIDELNLTGKLAGSKKNRVKAVRLRGELSQGIVARPSGLFGIDYEQAHETGEDFAERLGITKWVPEIPASMSGQVEPNSDLLPWVNIENIQRYPDMFTVGETVVATEKVHGSSTLYTYRVADGAEFMSSKGLASKGLTLRQEENNLYWRVGKGYNLANFAARVAQRLKDDTITHIGVFGEVFGAGVQDLAYGADGKTRKPGYQVFDIAVRFQNGEVKWVDTDEVRSLVEQEGEGLRMVPELYRGPYEPAVIAEVAEGKETISGQGLHIREGVVLRPVTETTYGRNARRKIGKWVSEAYLTRKGGTEYE